MEFQQLLVLGGIAAIALAGVLFRYWARQHAWRRSKRHEPREARPWRPASVTRRSRLEIVPLMRDDAVRISMAWRAIQARFADDPRGAVIEADRLMGELLYARAFPLGEIEAHEADISIDYPRLVKNYRTARGIAMRHAQGGSSAEDLRQAFVSQRTLFHDLLEREFSEPQPR